MALPLPAEPRKHFGKAGIFLLGVVCTAVVGVPTGIFVANRTNTAMILRQQQLTDLQGLEASGGQLDASVQQFSDALVDRKGVEQARQALRTAVAAHSSAAFSVRNTLQEDYRPYAAKLDELRNFADTAHSPREGVRVFQALADLIAMRRHAADHIHARVSSQ